MLYQLSYASPKPLQESIRRGHTPISAHHGTEIKVSIAVQPEQRQRPAQLAAARKRKSQSPQAGTFHPQPFASPQYLSVLSIFPTRPSSIRRGSFPLSQGGATVRRLFFAAAFLTLYPLLITEVMNNNSATRMVRVKINCDMVNGDYGFVEPVVAAT
jgi:hypothetical protein